MANKNKKNPAVYALSTVQTCAQSVLTRLHKKWHKTNNDFVWHSPPRIIRELVAHIHVGITYRPSSFLPVFDIILISTFTNS